MFRPTALQTTIDFDRPAGDRLAEIGCDLAVETANKEHGDWSERCWQLFRQWLSKKPRYYEFMMEQFRKHVYDMDLLERPKSDRAFGFVSKRAVKENLIMSAGTGKVANKKAHSANAGKWVKL